MSDTGTSAAAAAAATVAAAAANTGATTWFSTFDDDTKGYIANRGLDKLKPEEAFLQAAKAHREAEKHLGAPADKLVRLPKDAADTEGWKALAGRLGVPADGKYDFSGIKFKDGSDVDAEFTTAMSKVLSDAMVPKDRAAAVIKAIVDMGDNSEAAEVAARTAKLNTEREALKINWGSNVERNLVIADNAAAALGISKEQMDAMRDNLGASKVAEVFLKMGQAMGEDKFVGGGNGNGNNSAMSGEQAISRLNDLANDTAWNAKLNAGDAQAIQEFDNLTRIQVAYERAKKAAGQ